GPFELFDLGGLDITHAVMESIHDQFYQDPRYTPSSLVPARLAAGLLGRKTGQGFYRYEEGRVVEDARVELPQVAINQPFWLVCREAA
ncbi:3-hydroxyacyl-CoA dehydrogenase family protein, partial [Pseudomonas neuropathica]|uniref:3-hydroxyacyl-CoA dehydrogenase family protein n=1 Tax=Pseudomonas neuropathica TaxID=2730425 RepID=UPI0034D63F65